jgi:hypothetical protein
MAKYDKQMMEGREAFKNGLHLTGNPYKDVMDTKRHAWLWGWFSEKDKLSPHRP